MGGMYNSNVIKCGVMVLFNDVPQLLLNRLWKGNVCRVKGVTKSNFLDKATKNNRFRQKVYNQRYLLIMLIPCLLYYLIFKYIPMYGLIISFKKYDFVKGIMGSEWVGFKYFIQFFKNPYFTRVLGSVRNFL